MNDDLVVHRPAATCPASLKSYEELRQPGQYFDVTILIEWGEFGGRVVGSEHHEPRGAHRTLPVGDAAASGGSHLDARSAIRLRHWLVGNGVLESLHGANTDGENVHGSPKRSLLTKWLAVNPELQDDTLFSLRVRLEALLDKLDLATLSFDSISALLEESGAQNLLKKTRTAIRSAI